MSGVHTGSVPDNLLDVSIVVHGESPYVIPCLESVYKSTRTAIQVYVVANTGKNATIQRLHARFPLAHIIVNEQPRSFAANHNAVMAQTSGRYIALLNDDLVVKEGALDTLVGFLENHPDAGVASPRLLNPDGTLQPSTFGDPTLLKMLLKLFRLSGFLLPGSRSRHLIERFLRPRFPRLFARYWEHDRVAEAHLLHGAAMVVRRTALESVGPMAEVTKAYGEEMDWHLRFRQAGWKLYLVPQACMIHYKGRSTGGQGGRMLIEHRKSVLYYFRRHRPGREYAALRGAIILTHAIQWIWTLFPSLTNPAWRERRHIHRTIIDVAWRGLNDS